MPLDSLCLCCPQREVVVLPAERKIEKGLVPEGDREVMQLLLVKQITHLWSTSCSVKRFHKRASEVDKPLEA